MFTGGSAAASINLPDTFSISSYHPFAEKWAVMADATWTRWSLFDELKATFSADTPDNITVENWEDTWRYALGLTYYANENWTFRTGVAFDETPVPDAQHRTPRIPCEDRIWAALGMGYKISDRFGIDIGYAHLFVDDPEIDKAATGEDALRGGLQGTFDASVDILSVQLNIAF
jgi:long-chain fatty acid transport protein